MTEQRAHSTVHDLIKQEILVAIRRERHQRRIDDLAGFLGFSPELVADALELAVARDHTLRYPSVRGAA